AMTVTLFSTDPDEATVPQTVVIAAGQKSATFTVTGTQDFQLDGTHAATIVAAALGLKSGSSTISVTDSGVQTGTFYNYRGDQNTILPQGHIEIVNNTIAKVSGYGIEAIAGTRDA